MGEISRRRSAVSHALILHACGSRSGCDGDEKSGRTGRPPKVWTETSERQANLRLKQTR